MTHFRRLRSAGAPLGLVLGLFALLPSVAAAHTGAGPAHGVLHGFAHPFLGWDHVLAMVAVGLLAGQRGGRATWALPAAFVGAMVLGGIFGMAGLFIPGIEAGILASVLVLGALVAVAARFPLAAVVTAVSVFAVFHGHAHGSEMPAAASGLFYGAGFALATVLLHATGILGVRLTRGMAGGQLRWVRAAGAAISAAGLALWLVG